MRRRLYLRLGAAGLHASLDQVIDRTGRRLAAEVRAAVLAANDGLCCHCRVQVATEVDHLNGPSNDRINLQGLCHGCHIAKTMATLEPMGPLDYEVRDDFLACVYADTSCRPCYDEKVWQGIYQRLLANTRQWHAHAVAEVESGYFGDGSTGTIDDIEHGYYLQLLAERED